VTSTNTAIVNNTPLGHTDRTSAAVAGFNAHLRQARRPRREPVFTTDEDGQRIVRVPLNLPGAVATVAEDDFVRLRANGFTDQWTTWHDGRSGCSYVVLGVTGLRGSILWVSRLIAEAGRGQRVGFRDGNRLNLRRDNLVVTGGWSKGREKAGKGLARLRAEAPVQAAA
jgi:hypothetical protein